MKTSMKTLAMLTLSACVITGSAVSSFAATPVTAGAAVLGHQTSTCGDDDHWIPAGSPCSSFAISAA